MSANSSLDVRHADEAGVGLQDELVILLLAGRQWLATVLGGLGDLPLRQSLLLKSYLYQISINLCTILVCLNNTSDLYVQEVFFSPVPGVIGVLEAGEDVPDAVEVGGDHPRSRDT